MKTLFFDWGGVIADDPGDEFLVDLLKRIGANQSQVREIADKYMKQLMRGTITEQEYWNELRMNYGFDIHDSMTDEFLKWNGLIANQLIIELVYDARRVGWQTAILSNVIEPSYNALVAAGTYDAFDAVIASCREGYVKPETKIYKIALERLKTTPGESVFIDDKLRNLQPAQVMGFTTIHATSPEQIIRDIKVLL